MAKSSLSIDFKSSTFYALRLVLSTSDTDVLIADLNQRVSEAGDFYSEEGIIIDASNLEQAPDWNKLIKAIKSHGIFPLGVYGSESLAAGLQKTGLPLIDMVTGSSKQSKTDTGSKTPPKAASKKPTAAEQSENTAANKNNEDNAGARKTMVIKHPLRSGQSIYARNCDLLVIGMVSKGAEVIADGNIHVYGPLRGKAIAGASGDTDALILTTQLDAELLAIAGVYRVIETDLPNNLLDKAAKIELAGGTLKFQPLY